MDLRKGPSSPSSSTNTAIPSSDRQNSKLTKPTPPTTPSSSSSTTSPWSSPGLSSRSSTLSTPPASPFRLPTRSPSLVGRSQLNAASSANPIGGTSSGAYAAAPTTPEQPGEVQSLIFDLKQSLYNTASPPSNRHSRCKG